MALKIARRALVPPFIVMDVLRAANEREAAGEEVLHLEVGQPGTPAPAPVRAAAKAALETAKIGYTDALGLRSLRARIARSYAELYGVELDPGRVVVTTGSSGGFLLSFLASFEPGDRVALAAPGYPAYRNILASLGVEPVLLPCDLEHRFQPTVELLDRVTAPLDGLILASPSNPTGTMLERDPAVSALELTDQAIVINSFSKYYSMTGWRLGWMVLPEDLLRPVECLAQNLFISPPTLSQIAAEAAFDCREELDGYVAAYARNRALLLGELPKAGFDRLAPADGAFYLYADVSRLTNDSQDFCRRMLAETGVAITPGNDFDPERGHHFVRFSFAGLEVEMAQAAEILRYVLSSSFRYFWNNR
jgi:aspartate/methionine/tyrosine aminotransferase